MKHAPSQPDPVLLATEVGARLYTIGAAQPSSIRDQIFRAQLVIDRVIDAGLVSRNAEILIAGAGIGGVAAAIRSAQHGLVVTLIDERSYAFGVQVPCATRWLDPTQYDWPLAHWTEDVLPGPEMPIPYQAGYARDLAALWEISFKKSLRTLAPKLTFFENTRLVDIGPRTPENLDRTALLEIARVVGRVSKRFPLILVCMGMGRETCSVDRFAGYWFWQTDALADSDFGITGNASILISGGGDGALQDFIRAATGRKSAREVYESLPALVKNESHQKRIQDAEDQSQRGYLWSISEAQRHDISQALHDTHTGVIDTLFDDASTVSALNAWCHEVLHDRLSKCTNITLAYPCTHFGSCYALNRFLALLIARCISELIGKQVLNPNTKVRSIFPATASSETTSLQAELHSCTGDAYACYGQPHVVTFESGACDRTDPKRIRESTFNIIVLRHGVQSSDNLFDFPPRLHRHPLPYHWPWSSRAT
jgi:hypothetical protein